MHRIAKPSPTACVFKCSPMLGMVLPVALVMILMMMVLTMATVYSSPPGLSPFPSFSGSIFPPRVMMIIEIVSLHLISYPSFLAPLLPPSVLFFLSIMHHSHHHHSHYFLLLLLFLVPISTFFYSLYISYLWPDTGPEGSIIWARCDSVIVIVNN